ncbi:unnamed protein product [Angiostrongylus costaricensis]|uniref:Uncharacterized protein n=1 Tax=Angiostrongylus costaricensis TaxID=334426 RepID=A0A0R3PYZ8_ANGCS|nr:unnamed protein product [Angiostrongylus costaricensis]
MFDRLTGNGNGNKVNMRIHVLEQILSSIETDGSSARVIGDAHSPFRLQSQEMSEVNSLRQVIRRNKADMADDAGKSLDLMRRVSFEDILMTSTIFYRALQNHVVDQNVINDLCTSILDAAKVPFMRDRAANVNRNRVNSERSKREYESDESDVSILSKSSDMKRRRGRPRKYSCDEEDRSLLMEEKKLSRGVGRCYLMIMDDIKELLGRS